MRASDGPTATADLSGATMLIGVVGDPVEQVKAPALLNPLLRSHGPDVAVVPLHVKAHDLAGLLRSLRTVENIGGLLVTVPHKAAMCDLASRLGPAAALCGTANVARPTGAGAGSRTTSTVVVSSRAWRPPGTTFGTRV